VDEIMPVNNQRMIVYLNCFSNVAPVGGAPPLNERKERCGVDEIMPVNNQRMIIYLNCFSHAAPVGGAHL
jgi:hypothetical protein